MKLPLSLSRVVVCVLFSPVGDASEDRLPHYEATEDEEDVGRVGLGDAVLFYARFGVGKKHVLVVLCVRIYVYVCMYLCERYILGDNCS